MTKKDFYEEMCSFPDNFEFRDLETYLCALLPLVYESRAEEPNAETLLNILKRAFSGCPSPFEMDWLNLIAEPDRKIIDEISGYAYTIEVIKFQIAELRKMRNKQLRNELRYLGLKSETGNFWFNFDPLTNLERGVAGITGYLEPKNLEPFTVNWSTLGEILELGRIYE